MELRGFGLGFCFGGWIIGGRWRNGGVAGGAAATEGTGSGSCCGGGGGHFGDEIGWMMLMDGRTVTVREQGCVIKVARCC